MLSTVDHGLVTLLRRLHFVARERIYTELHSAGFTDISPSHIYVFQSPGPDGLRPTELATRVGMTKQALNHLLASLEEQGYLDRVPDPEDGRAKVIRITARGRELIGVIARVATQTELDWASVVGAERLEELRGTLKELDTEVIDDIDRLEAQNPAH